MSSTTWSRWEPSLTARLVPLTVDGLIYASSMVMLPTLPGVSIHLGQFKTGTVRMPLAQPPATGPSLGAVVKTEETASHVNLDTFLLVDAFRRDCDMAVVISNDSDLFEPIRLLDYGDVATALNDGLQDGSIHEGTETWRDIGAH